MAKNTQESLKILQKTKDKEVTFLTQWEILNHLSLTMLAPVEERPCAQTLFNLLHGLKKHFCAANDDEYQQFITDLLQHSPSKVDAQVKKNLNPTTEGLNIKNRIFC